MVRGFVDFEQAHILAAGDRHDDALRALHADAFEQRVGDRLLRGFDRAGVAARLAGAHHRLAHFLHHRPHVGKVEVDEARHDHQVGDPANALLQDFVGHFERFLEGRVRIGDQEQILVRNDDQRVDIFLKLFDAAFGGLRTALAFEGERLGHHPDGQDAHLTRGLCDHRGRTGAGAAAHAGGDEAHMRSLKRLLHLIDRFFRSGAPDFGACARAQPLRNVRAQLDALRRR